MNMKRMMHVLQVANVGSSSLLLGISYVCIGATFLRHELGDGAPLVEATAKQLSIHALLVSRPQK